MSVTFELNAEEAKFVRGVLKATDKLKGLEDQYKKTSRTSKKTGKSAKDDLDGIGSSAVKTAGQIAGITSVVGAAAAGVALLTREWQAALAVQEKAAQATITMAQARGGAVVNLPPDIKAAALDDFVKSASIKTGVSEKNLYTMATTALSAKGGVSNEGFFDAMGTSAILSAKTGLDRNVLAGGTMDLAKITGSENAKANIGWMRQVGSQARITSLDLQMKNVLPAIRAAQLQGATAETGAEWFTTINSFIMDPTGEKTRTGLINFSEKLASGKLVPVAGGGGGGLFGGGGGSAWKAIPEEFKTIEQKGAYLREIYRAADKETQAQMVKNFGGEGAMKAFYKGFLSGNEGLWSSHERIKGIIPGPGPESVAGYDSMMHTIDSAPQETVASIGRALDAAAEAGLTANTEGAMTSVTRAGLDKNLEASGMRFPGGWTKRKIAGLEFEARTFLGKEDPVDVSTDILGRQADFLDTEKIMSPVSARHGTGGDYFNNPEYNPGQAADLRVLIDEMRRQNGATGELIAEVKGLRSDLAAPVAARQAGMLD